MRRFSVRELRLLRSGIYETRYYCDDCREEELKFDKVLRRRLYPVACERCGRSRESEERTWPR